MLLLNFIEEFKNFSSFSIDFAMIHAKVVVAIVMAIITVIIITINYFIILKITKLSV